MLQANKINARLHCVEKTTVINQSNQFLEPEFNSITHVFQVSIEEVGTERIPSTEGSEQSVIVAEGRLVSPRFFPAYIPQQREMRIEWEQAQGRYVEGICTLRPRISSRLNLESVFGEKIRLFIKIDL
jgi:hypothetical protein